MGRSVAYLKEREKRKMITLYVLDNNFNQIIVISNKNSNNNIANTNYNNNLILIMTTIMILTCILTIRI